MESIKTYKAILLSVLGLVIVVAGSFFYMKHHKTVVPEAVVKTTRGATLSGKVTRIFEGENNLVYSMDIPETATSTLSMDDALVTINNEGSLFAAVYMSYEGGRGYSSSDYIQNVIAKSVPAIAITGTTSIAGVTWTIAEGGNSEWHIGQVGTGAWLMVVENRKEHHDHVVEMLESLITE